MPTWSLLAVGGEACGEKAKRDSRGALARAPLLPAEGPRETRQGSANNLPGQQAGGQGLRRTPSTPPSRQQTAAQALLN